MTINKEEGVYAGEFLISESDDGAISRDAIVVASGQGVVEAGSVLGVITASGKFAKYANAATDGTQVAVGVLYAKVDATLSDAKGVAVSRLAEVKAELLVYGLTEDAVSKSAAIVDLKTQFIIAR